MGLMGHKYSIALTLKKTILVLFAALLCVFIGCSGMGLKWIPKAFVAEKEKLPSRVAVLPFVNNTSNPEAGLVMRKMFYNFFSSLNYYDIEPGLVDEVLKKRNLENKILKNEKIDIARLGQFLGVDAVIFGEVTAYGKLYAVFYTDTVAELNARMVSCADGRDIWSLKHGVRQGQGGVPLSLTGLATGIIKSIVNYRQAEVVNAASRLSMEMVMTIPNPEKLVDPPPRIEVMVHNGANRLIRPGNKLKAVLVGESGNKASWKFANFGDPMPMEEKAPGTYFGTYVVKPEDKLVYGRLIGYLKTADGRESRWTDVLGPVSMGEPTFLPSVISEDLILKADKNPYFIKDALLIMPGAELKLQPGVVVWLHKQGIVVKGKITAIGTEENPIRISGLSDSEWKGILIDQSMETNTFSFCEISKAHYGLKSKNSKIVFEHCMIHNNGWGITLDGGSVKIKNCLIRASEKVGISARDAQVSMTGSIVAENGKGGLLFKNANVKIEQNNIYNNGQFDIKALDSSQKIVAADNWWGKKSKVKPGIIGDVEIKPKRTEPIKTPIFKQIFK